MAIIYALVARGADHVLAEYTSAGLSGNFNTVALVLLRKIPPQDSRMSYAYDRYVFHYIVTDGITYLCMADGDFSRAVAFQFLEEVKRRFISTYGDRAYTERAFAFNADFERVLESQMDHYNHVRGDDKLSVLTEEIREVKSVMIDNIDKVLERGERIELLVAKSEQLDQHAFTFKKGSRQLRRSMWWKNAKLWVILGIVAVIILYVILAASCGGMDIPKCR